MDTKWRKLSRNRLSKLIAFVLAVILLSTAAVSICKQIYLTENNALDINDLISNSSFQDSNTASRELASYACDVILLAEVYKSEEYLRSGGKLRADAAREEIMAQYQYYEGSFHDLENDLQISDTITEPFDASQSLQIIQDLEFMAELQRKLYNNGIYYFYDDGTNSASNSDWTRGDFMSRDAWMVIENGQITANNIEDFIYSYTYYQHYPQDVLVQDGIMFMIGSDSYALDPNLHIYIAPADTFFQIHAPLWNNAQELAKANFAMMCIGLIGFILLFIYLALVTGRQSKDNEVHLCGFDRLYTDLNILLFIGAATLCCAAAVGILEWSFVNNANPAEWLLLVIAIAGNSLGLALLLSLVRRFKNRSFLEHSMLVTILLSIYRKCRNILAALIKNRPLVQRSLLLTLGFGLICAILGCWHLLLALLFIIPIIWLVRKKAIAYDTLRQGVEHIKAGDLEYQIVVNDTGEMFSLAADINAINQGLKLAVEREVQSERLKSELISNVSHDLRTPLTSIINYIDLLQREGRDCENADQYLNILEQKAARLKTLTDDLFEVSKASSGNVEVQLDAVEIVALLKQGLGELDQQVHDSELEFRVQLPEEKIWVRADGRHLWRVIENLISNVLKYALPGSRVYIEPSQQQNWGEITIKNVSASELNIPVEELMERFKRGDESRSSEGSGLGLAIARNLMDLQEGELTLEIDGDLFKACVRLPLCAPPNDQDASPEVTTEGMPD